MNTSAASIGIDPVHAVVLGFNKQFFIIYKTHTLVIDWFEKTKRFRKVLLNSFT